MSIDAIKTVMSSSKSTGLPRMVLFVMATYASKESRVWASAVTIAKDCNTADRSVRRAIKSLVDLGEISDTGDRVRLVPVYEITVCTPDTPSGCKRVQNSATPDTASETPDETSGLTPDTPSPDDMSPLTHGPQTPDTRSATPDTRSAKLQGTTIEPQGKKDMSPARKAEMAMMVELLTEKRKPASSKKIPDHEIDEAVENYNQLCDFLRKTHAGCTTTPKRCAKTTAELSKAVSVTVKACGGLDGWREQIRKIAFDPFLRGTSKRSNGHSNWRVDLAWLTGSKNKKPNINRLIEAEANEPTTEDELAIATGQSTERELAERRAYEKTIAGL